MGGGHTARSECDTQCGYRNPWKLSARLTDVGIVAFSESEYYTNKNL